jgi:hypothetical protein
MLIFFPFFENEKQKRVSFAIFYCDININITWECKTLKGNVLVLTHNLLKILDQEKVLANIFKQNSNTRYSFEGLWR